jgi:diaminopimelate decarboxylase
MTKKPFVTLEQLEAFSKQFPTPYHLYDEKGIRANAQRLYEAFSGTKATRSISP